MVTGSSITRCGRNHILFRCSPHLKRREAPADVIEPPSWSCELCADVGGSGQINFIRFFEPFKHLRWGDRSFRQMRIERARADIWRVDQSRSRKFLGLSLVRKCFGYPCARSGFLGSNETYHRPLPAMMGHVPLDLPAMMRRSRGYAGRSPSATSPNFSEFWVTPGVTSGTNPFPAIQSLPPAGVPK